MATITRNVTGRIFEAPPTCLAASCAENVGAVAAATIPRGAITFPLVRSARRVARNATSGRVISTRTATSPSVGSTRSLSDAG